MKDIFGRNEHAGRGFRWDYHSVVSLQETELPWGKILGRDYVGVEAKIFIISVLITSIPLVAQGFDCEVGVVNLVYEVKNSERGKGDENENNCRKYGSDNFNFLRV